MIMSTTTTPTAIPAPPQVSTISLIYGPQTVADSVQCAVFGDYNNGNPFAYTCNSNSIAAVIAVCSCPTCCAIYGGAEVVCN
ncbi:hypothetical protein K503DRAFT_775671 [Rhizopogon vinicolor AM-OR11-026]|uniref:Uncharacterized protein n=1 Tax=Rhizopogon vinicolor AM-OR11-026 TaxID=1314800 RepID=A0A1B7MLB2_9AGAM|nr:hypothetical protein K503DRAFT_775671 [Rhizopogon vinicolor AM-OR11-026]